MAVRLALGKSFKMRGVPILEQLQLEELLLRTTEYNCVVTNTCIASHAIVLGFSGKPLELLHVEKVHRDGLQVIRRFTGGGTVIVDQDTVFCSLACNSSSVGCQPYPREIMKWTEDRIYGPVFHNLCSGEHGALSECDSKFALLENDYVWGDRKIGGNAQTITKARWVHHTSFLWKYNPNRMGYLKMPSKRPAYRADRAHTDFLAEIEPLLPAANRDPAVFCDAVHSALQESLAKAPAPAPVDELPAPLSATSQIVDRFLHDRAQGRRAQSAIDHAEFGDLYAELADANPQFSPRTVVLDSQQLLQGEVSQ